MDLDRFSTKKKRDKLIATEQRLERRVFVAVFKIILSALIFCVIVMAGAGFGMMKGILDDAPDVSNINIKPKGFKTIICDQNGNEIDSLSTANSNRVYVEYEQIPQQFINAFVAIEDERFWTHNGIDVRGIFRAIYYDVVNGDMSQGASTITQQLIKNQAFNVGLDENTKLQKIERKVQEQMLAIELEKIYSKEQIMENYLNTIYLGQGCNGIEAASLRYFDKSIGELNISEIALIAGITQNPYSFDPVIFPDKNKPRRADVLNKMKELGYITDAEYKAAKEDDVYARIKEVKRVNDENFEYNSYFKDAMMYAFVADLKEKYNLSEAEAFTEMYTGGYTIYITQDKALQEIADGVINNPDYYPASSSVALEYKLTILDRDGQTTHNYDKYTLINYYAKETGNSKYNNIYPNEDLARDAANRYKEAMLDKTGGTFIAEEFKTFIQPQATFTLIDQHTGYIKAMVGGRGEKTENLGFNRATDGMRQPGSCFKILAAFLPYIDTTGGLVSAFEDAPYKYKSGTPIKNWYSGYRGWATIRMGIQESMNIVAVKAITAVDPEVAYRYLIRMGFTTLVKDKVLPSGSVATDVVQPLALGGLTYGVTNLEITAAYAAIANMGTYIKPVYYSKVYDHDGNLIIDNTNPSKLSTTHSICKETTAWQLIEGMKDVVTQGTGTRARLKTGGVAAGKTGTTSNSYDLWFCGMTPYYTGSVWYGMDSNVTVDTQNHKYMWRDIMDQIAEYEGHDTSLDWERPEGITTVSLCKYTGLLPSEGCDCTTGYIAEENVPTKRCKGGHMTEIAICNESHMRATNACPDVTTYAVSRYSSGDEDIVSIVGADFEYDQSIFNSSCPIHQKIDADYIIKTHVAGGGGSIDGSQGVPEHGTITIRIYPSAGYKVSYVSVDNSPAGQVTEITFTDVIQNHTVGVIFEPIAAEQAIITPQDTEAQQPQDTQAPQPQDTEAPQPQDTEAPQPQDTEAQQPTGEEQPQ